MLMFLTAGQFASSNCTVILPNSWFLFRQIEEIR